MFERSPISIFLLERGWGSEGRRIQGTFLVKTFRSKKIMCIFHIRVVKDTSFFSKISHRHDTKWIIQ